jgi:acyl transferase domain-containing protein
MAALIKVILAMRHRTLPGIPRFTTLHENIALKNSHFRMTAENQKWEALTDVNGHEIPRRAGINNYGFSGVNAHMVLEEYVPPQISTEVSPVTSPEERQMIVFSAKNPERLRILVQQMRDFVASKQDTSFEKLEGKRWIAGWPCSPVTGESC